MEYSRGNFTYDGIFKKPTRDLFDDWVSSWLDHNGTPTVDLYLCGAFCSNYFLGTEISTTDIDVVLSGNMFRYTELKKLLDSGVSMGMDRGILVDIIWREDPKSYAARNTKILNYRKVEFFDRDNRTEYIVEGDCKELIPGLYLYSNFDTSKAIAKSEQNNDKINHIKINYEHVKRKG